MAVPIFSSSHRADSLAALQAHRTPASAYATERRLLRAYTRLLYTPTVDVEELMQQIWGPLTKTQMYGAACKQGRIDRLDDDIPDLIRSLRAEEQPELCALLLTEQPDLVAAIRYVLGLERRLLQREEDPRLLVNDERLAKAAGLGRISSQNYGCLRVTPVAPIPCLQPATSLLMQGPEAATTAHPVPPCQLRPKPRKLYAEVKRAQERKRLKRKRRQ